MVMVLTYWAILNNCQNDTQIAECISVGMIFSAPKHIKSVSYSVAYSYGTDNKIGLRLSICVSVCLSVCHHSHGRISLSIFTKFDTEV